MTDASNAAQRDLATDQVAVMTPGMTVFFAAAVAITVLNLFASQPLLGLIGPAFGMTAAQASMITTLTLLGYALGLVFVVPLVDLISNRRLILLTLLCCAGSLLSTSLAPTTSLLLASAVALGVTSTAVQMLVPIAAALTAPEARGRVVGNVMSGLMIGTLLSRPLASLVAEFAGWRSFYALSAVLIAVLTAAMAKTLPERRPSPGASYGSLIASLGTLICGEPVLRRRSAYQFLLMGAFSLFWTAIALRLTAPPYGLGQIGIAVFSLAAVGAVVIAPVAGRLADQNKASLMTPLFQGAVVLAFLLVAVADGAGGMLALNAAPVLSLALLGIAAFLLSLGVTGDQIIGRHAINMLQPEARGRLNGLYTSFMFTGGALGAFAAGPAWDRGGWPLVYLLALGAASIAALLTIGASFAVLKR
ncbi:Predicted arabinose efflux permease, MFS family [Bosea sp. CRIB-10]|uniref:MFS transporter n=1 Tax=Bosea sp. CRIB-10 TaxID=378404 RepID=UPI0008ECE4D6|nr:MFS transporter [Bosea sp. CRIB-10]SFD67382.1 Predicted arabinose efflux permease, MFS family [Bosea sp. CRIB-10]